LTGLLERRGRPSTLHEYRAATLSTMASLAGHTEHVSALLDGSRPDVVQLRRADCSLFIGDAKATETPGNTETFERLSRYADFLASWVGAGGSGVLALIVADVDAYGWLRVLRDLCLRPAGGVRVEGRLDLVEIGTAVAWQSLTGRGIAGGRKKMGWAPAR
jgi:hypothetical protein